ncbi:MAG TPA: hypothetical protein VNR68_07325 [Sphingomicrobium sp.]|jgi:hypothetical protein|nr:hypothetical protein [Sphingomicrobium sp.]
MRYFGSKQIVQPDENAIAAERLMAIASRYKADLPSSSEGFEIVPDSEEPLDLFEGQPSSEAPETPQ